MIDDTILCRAQAVDFAIERLNRGMTPAVVCSEMLDHCLAKDPKEARGIGCDNMTAELVILRWQK